jgi:hypothetical protein
LWPFEDRFGSWDKDAGLVEGVNIEADMAFDELEVGPLVSIDCAPKPLI